MLQENRPTDQPLHTENNYKSDIRLEAINPTEKRVHKFATFMDDKVLVDNISGEGLEYLERKKTLIQQIYDEAYGVMNSKDIPPLYQIAQSHFYSDLLKIEYSIEDWRYLNNFINHALDWRFTESALVFLKEKYLLQNRHKRQVYESPQVAFMLISAMLFVFEPDKKQRLTKVIQFYNYVSRFYINLPTPILAGLRSHTDTQYSSCTLINVGDSIESITKGVESVVKYASSKAGIGLNVGRIRAINQPVKQGTVVHTGLIPFIKLFEAALDSCSQGSLRKGSATVHYPWWHLEFDALIELKNNRGQDEFRARNLDYSVGLNKFFIERALKGKDILLFSPEEVPLLQEAFYDPTGDYEKFKRAYEYYEMLPGISKKTKNATEILTKIMTERANTGRIYIHFVDNMNRQSSFKVSLEQSNLCQEVTLPTSPCEKDEGEISMCTLSSINWGLIEHTSEFEPICSILVEALDNLLDMQAYMMPQSRISTGDRRPLGVGVTNFAYWLAKQGLNYDSPEALEKTFRYAEAQYFYLMKATCKLASIKGACKKHYETVYSDSALVFDFAGKSPSKFIEQFGLQMDWKTLRRDLKKHSVRNSTVMAVMPVESSSIITSTTNGIEPIRSLISNKTSKSGKIKFYAPEYDNPNIKYQFLWNIKSPKSYINLASIIQIFNDQAISSNITYNPIFFPEDKIPMETLIADLVHAYNMGLKTLYYSQINDLAHDTYESSDITNSRADTKTDSDCGCIL